MGLFFNIVEFNGGHESYFVISVETIDYLKKINLDVYLLYTRNSSSIKKSHKTLLALEKKMYVEEAFDVHILQK